MPLPPTVHKVISVGFNNLRASLTRLSVLCHEGDSPADVIRVQHPRQGAGEWSGPDGIVGMIGGDTELGETIIGNGTTRWTGGRRENWEW
jgi:hypothetical protein